MRPTSLRLDLQGSYKFSRSQSHVTSDEFLICIRADGLISDNNMFASIFDKNWIKLMCRAIQTVFE